MTFNSLDGSSSSDHIKLCLITAVWRVRETGARPETGSAHLCTPESRGDALSVYKYLDLVAKTVFYLNAVKHSHPEAEDAV